MKISKLIFIDYLRAASMLYVVGFWHLFGYTEAFPEHSNYFTERFTLVILGLFVFISGFLIGSAYNSPHTITSFYKKRLVRVYPLYVLAILAFFLLEINDAITSLKALIFISMYYGPPPLTLWFITMLMLFYIMSPVLIKYTCSPIKYLSLVALIFFPTIILQMAFNAGDARLLLYFPCYCLGIYCGRTDLRNKVFNYTNASIILFLGVVTSVFKFNSWTLTQLSNIPLVVSASYLIFTLCYQNESKFQRNSLVNVLSYSSFSMYLFHRPVYIALKEIYFPDTKAMQVFYLMSICLFLVTLIAWSIQKIYDKSYNYLQKKY